MPELDREKGGGGVGFLPTLYKIGSQKSKYPI